MSDMVAELFTEGHRLSPIYPASRTSVEANTGWVSMRDYHKAVFVVMMGQAAAATTFDAQILQATDVLGAGVKAITGKQITPFDTNDDNSMAVIELDCSELDVTNGFDCILGSISCGGAAAILCDALLMRYQPRFKPVGIDNIDEVVA
jgi:hypothetical protein